MSWRLTYENKKVYGLFESTGITFTNNSLFVANTIEECFDEVDSLALTMVWPSGDTKDVLFSAGTRTLIENPNNPPAPTELPESPKVPDTPQ